MSNFQSLYVGRNSLRAHRTALDVISHNMANAAVPGYSRQLAYYDDAQANSTPQGFLGNGAQIASVGQNAQVILERRLDQDTSSFHEARARYEFLTQVEVVYTDASFGVGPGITSFFNGWRELSTNPASMVAREEVIARGEDIADRFNRASERLDFLRRDMNGDLAATADLVTRLAENIATLNREIHDAEAGSAVANDMRDARQKMVREISAAIRVQTFTDDEGYVHVVMDQGQSLVSGRRSGSLFAEAPPADPNNPRDSGLFRIIFRDADQTAQTPLPKGADVTDQISGGELGGLIEARDNIVGAAYERLDTMVEEFVEKINLFHSQRPDPNNPGPPQGVITAFDRDGNQGGDFFVFADANGSPAQQIRVNPTVIENAALVAAAIDANAAPGDNRNALAIAELEFKGIINGDAVDDFIGGTSTHDSWANEIRSLGDAASRARRDLQRTETRRDQTQQVRESISGVNMDEELADLVRVQRAFEAAAKVVKTADETLQTILSLKS
ncbi:MAG TPA: flagellar hook-associated protein FlgK [Myxococcales bacterium]|nr:flagellar hook-associated protein FlgK [Myxococcales bacterium]HBU49446.1 flagellar hook-associated protein FlgK [Myxococcales bacterium]